MKVKFWIKFFYFYLSSSGKLWFYVIFSICWISETIRYCYLAFFWKDELWNQFLKKRQINESIITWTTYRFFFRQNIKENRETFTHDCTSSHTKCYFRFYLISRWQRHNHYLSFSTDCIDRKTNQWIHTKRNLLLCCKKKTNNIAEP